MAKKKKEKLPNIHPGEILEQEFLEPLGISHYRLAKDIGVPQTRIAAIIKHKRAVTPDSALRLSKYFGTTPDFWLNLQAQYDLEEVRKGREKELAGIKRCPLLDDQRASA